jgi:nucleolar protein 15
MSSATWKKVKRLSKTKQVPAASLSSASLSKEPDSKLSKAEGHVTKAKVKPLAKVTHSARKVKGPWKPPSPSPSPSQSEEDEPEVPQEESSDGPEEENIHLYGFSTDEDSSDEDLDVGEGTDFDVGALPTIARDDATVKRKLEKAKRKPVRLPFWLSPLRTLLIVSGFQATETGVVYLGRIPHGFYEDQMRAYFSQFGDISRLRLSRNKRVRILKPYITSESGVFKNWHTDRPIKTLWIH